MEGEAADEDVDGRELAEHADARGVDADLFVRLPYCRLRQRLAGIRRAARQADLPGVAAQAARAHRERNRGTAFAWVEEQQTRGEAGGGPETAPPPTRPPGRRHGAPTRRQAPRR